ncbi:hypothetical protein Hsar01_01383 [Haloferula sargassicola]|uniref:Uncharacterized protein n=2 Tax=Haloferula sargassicola TaxID=490096 RepID=A0ABP9UNC5_9BACT
MKGRPATRGKGKARRPGGWSVLLCLAGLAPGAAEPDGERFPTAEQVGPSCAFFANVPAVTLATGVDISSSGSFARSSYGLRRGDFHFHRSFDKRILFELFSLPYAETWIDHPEAPREELLPVVRDPLLPVFFVGAEPWALARRSL